MICERPNAPDFVRNLGRRIGFRLNGALSRWNTIIGALKESEAGAKTDENCRRHDISSATL